MVASTVKTANDHLGVGAFALQMIKVQEQVWLLSSVASGHLLNVFHSVLKLMYFIIKVSQKLLDKN